MNEETTTDGSAENVVHGAAFEKARTPRYANQAAVSGFSLGGDSEILRTSWRFKQAAIKGALFALRWGLAVVLLGIVIRVALTEILVPPIYRMVRDDIAAAKEQGKAGGMAAGYLQIAVERGLLPTAEQLGKLPKKAWAEEAPTK